MTYMSTAERLVKLHDKMCDNIEAMGGTVDPTKTLIEIADAILDIPPVPVGVSIDTATTCSADKSTTTVSSPVTFTGKVSAYHDDETSANVDLIGYLKGATVKFYNGQTLLGSTTTDNNGEYSFSYTPSVAGEMSVIAMFEAIEDYKQSSSTAVVITVSSYSDIVMSADKPILSYADGDKATLYAQLVDDNDAPLTIEGVTLTFKKDSTVLGTANTDSTGLATLVDGYTSQGVGDVTLSVTDGSLVSKTYEVSDRLFYDDATTDKSSKYVSRCVGNGKSCTISYANNEYHLTATGSGTSWYGVSPISVSTSDNWEITSMIKVVLSGSDGQFVSLGLANGGSNHIEHILYPKSNPTSYAVYGYGSPNSYIIPVTNVSLSENTYYTFKVKLVNGVVSLKVYNGETLIIDTSYTLPSNYEDITVYPVVSCFGNTNVNNTSTYFKEYSVKPL